MPEATAPPAAPVEASSAPETAQVQPAASPVHTGELSLDQWDQFQAGVPSTPAPEGTPGAVAPGRPQEEGEPPEVPAGAPPSDDPDTEALIQQFAKETGLDASNPDTRKVLKRLADKESHIRKLESERSPGQTADELTDFEREILAETMPQLRTPQPAGQPPMQVQMQGPAGPPQPAQFGDIGDKWQQPVDGYKALQEAWTNENFEQAFQIDNAMFARRLDFQMPSVLAHVNALFEARMNQIPEFRQTLDRAREDADHEFALKDLERKSSFADVRNLFKPEANQKPIVFAGNEYDPTPFNRVVAENPHILEIRKEHRNPRVAARLTTLAKMKAVHQLWKRGAKNGVPVAPATVKQILDAGAEMERRTQQDRARQGINGGRGTATTTQSNQSGSYVKSLLKLPGDPSSLDD